jgi:hypothetical protein
MKDNFVLVKKLMSVFFLCLALSGCKEFYDEEFEEYEERGSQSVSDEAIFSADLLSTDSSLGGLSGFAQIELSGERASIEVNVKGIPGNIGQITYRLISAPCSSLSLSIPQSNFVERTFELREGLTRSALLEDLRSSGSPQEDLSLRGKTFVIRGTPQFSGLPNEAGTNELAIACGELSDSSSKRNEASDVFLPPLETNEGPQGASLNNLEVEF